MSAVYRPMNISKKKRRKKKIGSWRITLAIMQSLERVELVGGQSL